MKRAFFVFMIIAVCTLVLVAEVKFSFPELNKPNSLSMDKENIYIGDGATIYIIDKDTGKVKNKFGKEGMGPQEFNTFSNMVPLLVFPRENDIVINSMSKLSFFGKDGKYIDEVNTKTGIQGFKGFFPFLDHYVGFELQGAGTEKMGFSIGYYDSDLKKGKEIANFPMVSKGGKTTVFGESPLLKIHKDKVYFSNALNMKISVFDKNGQKINSFEHPWDPILFTENLKNEYFDYFKSKALFRDALDQIKASIEFPKVLPAMRDFNVDGKFIYVLTYKKDIKGTTIVIFDIKGKFIKSVIVPFIAENLVELYPYWFENGKLYQIVEDDEEVWELHVYSLGI